MWKQGRLHIEHIEGSSSLDFHASYFLPQFMGRKDGSNCSALVTGSNSSWIITAAGATEFSSYPPNPAHGRAGPYAGILCCHPRQRLSPATLLRCKGTILKNRKTSKCLCHPTSSWCCSYLPPSFSLTLCSPLASFPYAWRRAWALKAERAELRASLCRSGQGCVWGKCHHLHLVCSSTRW